MTFFDNQGFSNVRPSTLTTFPTDENPDAGYKIASVDVMLGADMRQISRQTYTVLDWFGDWGGLLDALFLIAETLVYPFSLSALYDRVAAMAMRKKRNT